MRGALLAVDVGLRTGLALFSRAGTLLWCRSHNLGNATRLKKASVRLFVEQPDLEWVVVEGGGRLADIWIQAAEKKGLKVLSTQAEVWRVALLYPRECRSGRSAKEAACRLAHHVLKKECTGPAHPRHDAAEAVMIGLWALARLGWRDVSLCLDRSLDEQVLSV